MNKSDCKLKITKISEAYFDYMAASYPVMCLNDEFYFFPRAKKGIEFLNSLDSLDEEKIEQDISYIRSLKGCLDGLNSKDMGLEVLIDRVILIQSMSAFLREFGEIRIWQTDPSLYLKILLLGIDQIITKISFIRPDTHDSLKERIAQIPRLLNEAKSNLRKVPLGYLEVALEMVDASIYYFKNTTFIPKNKPALLKETNSLIKKALESLTDFKRFLTRKPSHAVFIEDKQFLEDILKYSFSYKRGLKEIFEIAYKEYRQTLKQLARAAKELNPKESWQEILSGYRLDVADAEGLLRLYSDQIDRIKNFIREKDVITVPKRQDILIRLTPEFMRPIRASASYSSAVTDCRLEPAYFYVTAKKYPFSNVHNEYIFVTAHETYPGHHLLDSVRHSLRNPIRQQIESPLFYEGWASYAERLIDELGYTKNPLQRLIGLKRQAWRAVRAVLDVGIRINKLKPEDAEDMLKDLGYTPRIAKMMLRHYLLSPGYQLCYTIGKFEIDKLKRKYSVRLGLKRFHDLLLGSGQIPFDLIEKRIQSQL